MEGSTREGISDQGASEQIHARTEPCWTNGGLGAGRGRGGAWRLWMWQSVRAHSGGRRGCGCRRGGSPRPAEKQQEAVGSELERDPWPPRHVHWRRLRCRIRGCMPVAGAGGGGAACCGRARAQGGRDGGAAATRPESRERVLFPWSDVSFLGRETGVGGAEKDCKDDRQDDGQMSHQKSVHALFSLVVEDLE